MTRFECMRAWVESGVLVGMKIGAAIYVVRMAKLPCIVLGEKYRATATLTDPTLGLFIAQDVWDTDVWNDDAVVTHTKVLAEELG